MYTYSLHLDITIYVENTFQYGYKAHGPSEVLQNIKKSNLKNLKIGLILKALLVLIFIYFFQEYILINSAAL